MNKIDQGIETELEILPQLRETVTFDTLLVDQPLNNDKVVESFNKK